MKASLALSLASQGPDADSGSEPEPSLGDCSTVTVLVTAGCGKPPGRLRRSPSESVALAGAEAAPVAAAIMIANGWTVTRAGLRLSANLNLKLYRDSDRQMSIRNLKHRPSGCLALPVTVTGGPLRARACRPGQCQWGLA